MKVYPNRHFALAVTMKAFLALFLLAAHGLAAEFNWEHLKPHHAVLPVNPMYTAQEWEEIYAGQKPRSEYFPNTKQEYAGEGNELLNEENERIVGGDPVLSCTVYPFMAAIITDNSYFCGGALINNRWVLTAAHCIGGSHRVIMGTINWNYPQLDVLASLAIVHPAYQPGPLHNDIALLQLPTVVQYSICISPVRLRYVNADLDGEALTAVGWGGTFFGGPVQTQLRHVTLIGITNTECIGVYGAAAITCRKICTTGTGPKSTCQGDSGGPLLYQESDGVFTQIGITSFVASVGCDRGYPAGFTRLNYYLCWIRAYTGLNFCHCT